MNLENEKMRSKNPEILKYKTKHSFAERKNLSKKLRTEHKNYVPIIIINDLKTSEAKPLYKLLLKKEDSVCKLISFIKEKINYSDKNGSLFITINDNITPKITSEIDYLFNMYKDEDDLLYIVFKVQDSFGYSN